MAGQGAPLVPTWSTRELPILRSVLERVDSGAYYVDLKRVQAEIGLGDDQMRAGLIALERADPPYLEIQWLMRSQAKGNIKSVSERARRGLGTWPTSDDVLARLVAALQAQAEGESDPAQRSRLSEAARVIGGVARDVVVAVFSQKLGTL